MSFVASSSLEESSTAATTSELSSPLEKKSSASPAAISFTGHDALSEASRAETTAAPALRRRLDPEGFASLAGVERFRFRESSPCACALARRRASSACFFSSSFRRSSKATADPGQKSYLSPLLRCFRSMRPTIKYSPGVKRLIRRSNANSLNSSRPSFDSRGNFDTNSTSVRQSSSPAPLN